MDAQHLIPATVPAKLKEATACQPALAEANTSLHYMLLLKHQKAFLTWLETEQPSEDDCQASTTANVEHFRHIR